MLDLNKLSCAEAMEMYAGNGISVFPCNGKVPTIPNGHKGATCDPAIIKSWLEYGGFMNIGIPTGAVNGFIVVDIDMRPFADNPLETLEATYSKLTKTLTVETGRGFHFYYKYPGFPVKNSAGAISQNVDVRGDGGYVIAPPSIHHTGRQYLFRDELPLDNFMTELAEAPDWLLERLRSPLERESGVKSSKPEGYWRDFIGQDVEEGGRNDAITRLVGLFLSHKLDAHVALQCVKSWNKTNCSPPLPQEEVEQVFMSIAMREIEKRERKK